ncbi:hypothetical protein [Mitsuokella sp. WILCCON 0060]|uniref:hypothetical protein n=1 Tax=Mitsuokella sp. WILCCON 0060 TaxID=3345341 RepID=UPI003F19418A
MKIYFLTEDSKSFFYVLPHWLRYMLPEFHEADGMADFHDNSFLVETGGGYPRIKKQLQDTIKTFQQDVPPPDYFIVCYDTDDADEEQIESDRAMFASYFQQADVSYSFHVLPMKRCFETWLLGNRAAWPAVISDDFAPFANHYPVNQKDPEDMERAADFQESNSMYHFRYLQKMLRCSVRKNYSKRSPGYVANESYLSDIRSRVMAMDDIKSFQSFLKVMREIRMRLL